MLTADSIKLQPNLAHLTDDDIAAITALSKHDEDALMSVKTKEWYDKWDAAILEKTGIPKLPREQAFDYFGRAYGEKTKDLGVVETSKQTIADLQLEIAELKEGKIDKSTQKKITDLQSELALAKTDIAAKEKAISDKENELLTERQDAKLNAAMAKMTFKPDTAIDASVKETFIKDAKTKLLAEATLEIVDGAEQWRDSKGEIIRNPKNGNAPITTEELLQAKLTPILDTGRQASGAGSSNPKGQGASLSPTIQAANQIEFNTKATDYLIAQGVERGTKEFTTGLTKLREDNGAKALPMQ